MLIPGCVCVCVSGGSNQRGWCLAWEDGQTAPCLQTDSNYPYRYRERTISRGQEGKERKRESDDRRRNVNVAKVLKTLQICFTVL